MNDVKWVFQGGDCSELMKSFMECAQMADKDMWGKNCKKIIAFGLQISNKIDAIQELHYVVPPLKFDEIA